MIAQVHNPIFRNIVSPPSLRKAQNPVEEAERFFREMNVEYITFKHAENETVIATRNQVILVGETIKQSLMGFACLDDGATYSSISEVLSEIKVGYTGYNKRIMDETRTRLVAILNGYGLNVKEIGPSTLAISKTIWAEFVGFDMSGLFRDYDPHDIPARVYFTDPNGVIGYRQLHPYIPVDERIIKDIKTDPLLAKHREADLRGLMESYTQMQHKFMKDAHRIATMAHGTEDPTRLNVNMFSRQVSSPWYSKSFEHWSKTQILNEMVRLFSNRHRLLNKKFGR